MYVSMVRPLYDDDCLFCKRGNCFVLILGEAKKKKKTKKSPLFAAA